MYSGKVKECLDKYEAVIDAQMPLSRSNSILGSKSSGLPEQSQIVVYVKVIREFAK